MNSNTLVKPKYLIILMIFCIGLYSFYKGPLMSPDSGTFSNLADVMILKNFNIITYFKSNESFFPLVCYTFTIYIISILKYFSHDYWQYLFVCVNLSCYTGVFILLYKIMEMAGVKNLISCISLVLLFFSIDFQIWPRYILTDSIFMFLSLFTLYTVQSFIIQKNKIRFLIQTILLCFLVFITRPSSLPIISSSLFCILIALKTPNLNFSKYLLYNLLFILFLFLIIIIYYTQFMLNTEITFLKTNQFKFIHDYLLDGNVIDARPETYLKPDGTFLSITAVIIKRIVYFYGISFQTYSIVHTVLNFIFFIPVYTFTIIGFFAIFLKSKFDEKKMFIFFSSIVFIISITVYHALTIIDYDHRYRLPIIPILIITFSLTANELFEIFRNNFNLKKIK